VVAEHEVGGDGIGDWLRHWLRLEGDRCVRLFGPIGYGGWLDGVLAVGGGEDLAVGKGGDDGGHGDEGDVGLGGVGCGEALVVGDGLLAGFAVKVVEDD